MSRRIGIVFALTSLFLGVTRAGAAASEPPRLMQTPTLSRTQIVFALGGHLWSVARGGGEARQLTSGDGVEADPHFSPDGRQIAFTGTDHGNADVFVMPAEGGAPRRLTYYPLWERVLGW